MAKVTPQEWLDKWGRRLNAAAPDMAAGIDRVKTAPGQSAADAQELMLARITEAIQSGRWAKAVSAVTLSDWQDAMKTKAIPRIAAGVAVAQKRKTAEIAALLDAVDQAAAEAHKLPKGTIEQSIARASAYMRKMSELAPKRNRK